jgi:hypothetical protein
VMWRVEWLSECWYYGLSELPRGLVDIFPVHFFRTAIGEELQVRCFIFRFCLRSKIPCTNI